MVTESDVVILQQAFNSVTRRVPSVDARKENLSPLLSQIDRRVQELRTTHPTTIDGPVIYDTSMCSFIVHRSYS